MIFSVSAVYPSRSLPRYRRVESAVPGSNPMRVSPKRGLSGAMTSPRSSCSWAVLSASTGETVCPTFWSRPTWAQPGSRRTIVAAAHRASIPGGRPPRIGDVTSSVLHLGHDPRRAIAGQLHVGRRRLVPGNREHKGEVCRAVGQREEPQLFAIQMDALLSTRVSSRGLDDDVIPTGLGQADIDGQVAEAQHIVLDREEVQWSNPAEPVTRDLVAADDEVRHQVVARAGILVVRSLHRRRDLLVGEGRHDLGAPIAIAVRRLAECGLRYHLSEV